MVRKKKSKFEASVVTEVKSDKLEIPDLNSIKLEEPPKAEQKKETSTNSDFINFNFDDSATDAVDDKQKELQRVRKQYAKAFAQVETVIVKALSGAEVDKEHTEAFETSWKTLADIYITDMGNSTMMAWVTFGVLQAGVLSVYAPKIMENRRKNLLKKETEKQEVKEEKVVTENKTVQAEQKKEGGKSFFVPQ